MSDLYEDRDSGSSSENNRTSDPSLKENEGNAETASSSEQHVDEKTTYSWVNPKLRQSGSDQTENNPWSGGGDGNYWRYSDDRGNGTGMDRKGRRNLDQDHQVKRPRRSGRHWTTVIAMAVVFGLIAGLVAYGVNYIGNRIHPVYSTASAGENADKKDLSGEKEPEKSENVSASSETAVSSDIPTTGKQQDMSVAEVA